MTELEQTQFQQYPDLRENFSENLEQMPDSEKEKLDYIWVCVIDGKAFPQFLDNGEELKFATVREEKTEETPIEAVYYVPLDPEKDSIGIEDEQRVLKPLRRGYSQLRKHSVKTIGEITDILYRHAQDNDKGRFKEKLASVMHNDGEMTFSEELHRYCYLIEAGEEVAFISNQGEVEVKEDKQFDMKTYKDEDSSGWKKESRFEDY